MPNGEVVNWLDGSKTALQRKCKFTLCFESTNHYGFVTEKIMDAFYSDTIPVYYGSPTVAGIFNKELKEISKDTEQQKALNEVVHSIKKYSLEYRSRHVTDMKELQTLMEEKRKLQTLQISF